MRKPALGVSDLVGQKPVCTTTEDIKRLETSDLESRGIVISVYRKTKALISCVVTAQLICVFVFTYAKSRFSHTRLICKVQIRGNFCMEMFLNMKFQSHSFDS